jgi:hypothetical protein
MKALCNTVMYHFCKILSYNGGEKVDLRISSQAVEPGAI